MGDKNPDSFTAIQREALVDAGLLSNRQPVFLLGLLADAILAEQRFEALLLAIIDEQDELMREDTIRDTRVLYARMQEER